MPNEIGKWTRAQLRRFIVLVSGEGGGGSAEGTAVLSTGESGGSKFLREDGDGTSSWQTPPGGDVTWTGGYSGTSDGGKVILKHGTGTTVASQLYFFHTDGSWDSTDADAVATGASQLLGVAIGTSPTTNGMLLKGFVQIAASLVNGTAQEGFPVYVSEETGEFDFTAPTGSGDFIRVVGYCVDISGSNILLYFDPDPTWVEVT